MQNGGNDGKSSAPNTLVKMAGASRVQKLHPAPDPVQEQQLRLRCPRDPARTQLPLGHAILISSLARALTCGSSYWRELLFVGGPFLGKDPPMKAGSSWTPHPRSDSVP